MVRTTNSSQDLSRRPARTVAFFAASCLALLALLGTAGCNNTPKPSNVPKATGDKGSAMAGPKVDVHIPGTVLTSKPKPWDLSTPESAVRSYLDWTNYSYRTATSDASSATMSPKEAVRVDSYVQYNTESKKLLDQELKSISFGKPSVGATSTTITTTEQWTYTYRSVEQGNKIVGGPFDVSYDARYTVIKQKNGQWVVDAVAATKTSGTLK